MNKKIAFLFKIHSRKEVSAKVLTL